MRSFVIAQRRPLVSLASVLFLAACTTLVSEQERADIQVKIKSSGRAQISNVRLADRNGRTHFTAQVAQGFKPGSFVRFPRLHLDLTVAENKGATSVWRIEARGWSKNLRWIRNGDFEHQFDKRLATGSVVTVTYDYDDSHHSTGGPEA